MTRDDGVRLRAWLEPRLTGAELARAAGCSRQYVWKVLHGQRPPSARLIAAARDVGIPVDLIFGGKGGDES